MNSVSVMRSFWSVTKIYTARITADHADAIANGRELVDGSVSSTRMSCKLCPKAPSASELLQGNARQCSFCARTSVGGLNTGTA